MKKIKSDLAPTSLKLLEQFYTRLEESEWEAGLDLFQLSQIKKINQIGDLIVGTIHGHLGESYEIRMKFHPSRKMIQWIECTCKKNRIKGDYCSHLTAFLLHMSEEKSDLFLSLDFNQPLKVDLKRKNKEKSKFEAEIAQNKDKEKLHPVCKARFGYYAYMIKEETICLEKSLFLDLTEELQDVISKNATEFLKIVSCFELKQPSWEETKKVCLSMGIAKKYLQQKVFHIPQVGSFELLKNPTHPMWIGQTDQLYFKADEAAALIENSYYPYFLYAPIFIDSQLAKRKILQLDDFDDIEIKNVDSHWFYLDPKYLIDGSFTSMIDILDYLKQKKRKYIKKNDSWVKIPDFVLENKWNYDSVNKTLQTDIKELLKIKSKSNSTQQFSGRVEAIEKIKKATEFDKNIILPKIEKENFHLRPYQEEGVKWFFWLYKNGLHGLLADDMGLGKTHQAMGIMNIIQKDLQEDIRFLVICPTSVLDHWENKVKMFSPNLHPVKYHGNKRSKQTIKNLQNATLITSYGILNKDIKDLIEKDWTLVILDEAHLVKNHNTNTYKSARLLKSRMRLCLTGTPLENNLLELKNIFDFLLPGYLGSTRIFRREYARPIEKEDEETKKNQLRKTLDPLKLRRTKNQVLSDLPEKIEDVRHCQLSEEQAALYKEALALRAGNVIQTLRQESSQIPFLHVFAAIQILKQICDHPAILSSHKHYKRHQSGKFDALKDIIQESLANGFKIVIFSQYLEMIRIISAYLSDIHVRHLCLTGETQKRGALIESFQNDPDIKIFVSSLMAGGMGIDLTAASVVIHYDRWWNASKENQATDRVHRIGQTKAVQVFKFICKDTLEEKIHRIIERKQIIFDDLVETDEKIFKSFTREDLLEIFSPPTYA